MAELSEADNQTYIQLVNNLYEKIPASVKTNLTDKGLPTGPQASNLSIEFPFPAVAFVKEYAKYDADVERQLKQFINLSKELKNTPDVGIKVEMASIENGIQPGMDSINISFKYDATKVDLPKFYAFLKENA